MTSLGAASRTDRASSRAKRDQRATAVSRPRRAEGDDRLPRASKALAAPPTLANSGARLRQATAIVLALFVVLGIRLVVFQFTDAPTYAEFAASADQASNRRRLGLVGVGVGAGLLGAAAVHYYLYVHEEGATVSVGGQF